MNDGPAPWETLQVLPSPSRPSPNPWATTPSTGNTFTDISITPSVSSTTSATRSAGGSTSVNNGASGTAVITNNVSIGLSSSSSGGVDIFSSGLRPRAGLRRLRSESGPVEESADAKYGVDSGSKPLHLLNSGAASDDENHPSFNGSATGEIGRIDAGPYRGTSKESRRLLSSNHSLPSSSLTSRRASRERSAHSNTTLRPPGQENSDWYDNGKTQESKVRKGKRYASPFSFGLGGGFGAKLWEDVENLLNATLTPLAGGDQYMDGKDHAYLDVWGRPMPEPATDVLEAARGREKERPGERQRGSNDGFGTRGPLEEREVGTSTTPALSRKTTLTRQEGKGLVSGMGADVLDTSRENSRSRSATREREAEVFEHIVQPTDSLAGVALKYGITVAQLRKCNKMWASDTIHLRKVLYIPVGARRPNLLPPPGELVDLSLSGTSTSSSPSKSPLSSRVSPTKSSGFTESPPNTPVASCSRTLSSMTVSSFQHGMTDSSSIQPSKSVSSTPSTKRVPLSELSYFPPPAAPSTTIFTSNPHPSTISAAKTRKWELENGASVGLFGTVGAAPSSTSVSPQPSQSRATSPSRGMPTSIFNVFPALNDLNIPSRVSFESVRSAGGSTPGSGNASADDDLELDEIVKRNKSRLDSRDLRKRVKLKPRAGIGIPEDDKAKGKEVITEQLGRRMMELPTISPGPTNGSYGNKWKDPGAH